MKKFTKFHGDGYCGTNLMSVAQLLVSLRDKGYAEEDFPSGIICISDGEFNSVGRNQSVFTAFRQLLRTRFSKEFVDNFVMVLWDIPNGYYSSSPRPKF